MLADIVDAETAPRSVQVRVLGSFAAIAVLLAGIGIHGLLAFAVSNRAQELLAGVSPRDAATFAAAVAVAVVMTLAGSLLPALRAIRVDPLTAIRAE